MQKRAKSRGGGTLLPVESRWWPMPPRRKVIKVRPRYHEAHRISFAMIDSYAKKSCESVISVLAAARLCGHARCLSSATIDRSLCRTVDVDWNVLSWRWVKVAWPGNACPVEYAPSLFDTYVCVCVCARVFDGILLGRIFRNNLSPRVSKYRSWSLWTLF